MSLKELKSRINGIKSTHKITSAMKMVAIAKFQKIQHQMLNAKQYIDALETMGSLLGKAYFDALSTSKWYKNNKASDLVIIIGADKGLCGSFHQKTLKNTLSFLDKNKDAYIFCIGTKLKNILYKNFSDKFLDYNYENDCKITYFNHFTNFIYNLKANEKINNIYVVSSEFISNTEQKPTVKKIIPINFEQKSDITVLDPDPQTFLDEFLNQYISSYLYFAWFFTHASEVCSRMQAMDSASKNANDMLNKLQLEYNRQRQTQITKELIEIISGSQGVTA